MCHVDFATIHMIWEILRSMAHVDNLGTGFTRYILPMFEPSVLEVILYSC